jgi:hypothetical protein
MAERPIERAPPPGPTTRFDHPDARLSRLGRGQARPEMEGSPHPGFIADTQPPDIFRLTASPPPVSFRRTSVVRRTGLGVSE